MIQGIEFPSSIDNGSLDALQFVGEELAATASAEQRPSERIRGIDQESHDTFMNGFFINQETYAILGFQVFDLDIQVYGKDELFITMEPRNSAPLESVIVHMASAPPALWIFDWGVAHQGASGWVKGYVLDPAFLQRWAHQGKLPDGSFAPGLLILNGYIPSEDRNLVVIRDTSGRQEVLWRSPVSGKPRPAPVPTKPPEPHTDSGWAVVEWKRSRAVQAPWPVIPRGTGVSIGMLYSPGHQFQPSGAQTNDALQARGYRRICYVPGLAALFRGP